MIGSKPYKARGLMISFGCAVATLHLAGCAVKQPIIASAQEPSDIAKIEAYLAAGEENGFSGAVLVARNGEILLNRGYGMANKAEGIANTPETVFDIGSVSKQFTATAIVHLSERGQIGLHDTLDRFFPAISKDKAKVTIHQLLTHSAGFIEGIGESDFHHIPRDDYFREIFNSELKFVPGARHSYSNAGYSILARIIELVSGQDYETYLFESLFEPAGMLDTGFLRPDWRSVEVANGYPRNIMDMGSAIERYEADGEVSWVVKGNGGINSTVNDMYRWYQALKDNVILSDAGMRKLTTPYVDEQPGGESQYAYGWAIFRSKRNTKIVTHNGGNGIFFHELLWLPEEDTVIILATNAYSSHAEVAWPIERMLFDPEYTAPPIVKNIYQYVFEFAEEHPTDNASQLETELTKSYPSEIRDPSTLNRIGRIMIETDHGIDWAVQILKLNLESHENHGETWLMLGDGYRKRGQEGKARSAYEKAEQLGIKDAKARMSASG